MKTQMLVSVVSIIGLCLGIVVLSPMQEPAIDMAFAPVAMGNAARQGSMGALARNAPVTGLNFRGLNNPVSVNAIDPRFARSGYRPVVVNADSELLQRLDFEIQKARACTENGTPEECLVAWDAVEELSAAVAHTSPKTSDSQFPKLSDADMKTFKATMEKYAAAREKVDALAAALPSKDARDSLPAETYESMAAALKEKQAVVAKFANVRLAGVEEKIQKAKAEAMASGKAVDWDIVEELMQERSHLMKFDGST